MKKNSIFGFILAAHTIITSLYAAPGCKHNSLELSQSFGDYKNWHYVACTCPCERRYEIRQDGRCYKCQHLRSAIPLVQPETNTTIDVKKLMVYVQQQKASSTTR